MLTFDNRFVNELPGDPNPRNHSRQVQGAFWSRVDPTPVAAPRLIAHSPEVAAMLGLSEAELQTDAMVNALSGYALVLHKLHRKTGAKTIERQAQA